MPPGAPVDISAAEELATRQAHKEKSLAQVVDPLRNEIRKLPRC